MPLYESLARNLELGKTYPRAMISSFARNFLHSSFVNVMHLRDMEGEPYPDMHSIDAAAPDINNGNQISIHNVHVPVVAKVQI